MNFIKKNNKINKNIKPKSSLNKKLIIVLALIFLPITILFFIANFFYRLAIDPKSDRSKVFSADHNKIDFDEITKQTPTEREANRKIIEDWKNSVSFEDWIIDSHDNLKLHALSLTNPEKSNKWAILCHGYTDSAKNMSGFGKNFYENNYNILVPDARGHGDSEGNYIGMGWHERLDIVNWINFLVENNPECEILLYGISMGGATVMMVSGEENLPNNLKAIVEDCGYTSVWDEFGYQMKSLFKIPAFPILHACSLITKLRSGYSFKEATAIEQLKKCTVPILFIHGSEDTFVPANMVQKVYDATNSPKDIVIVEGAGHGLSSTILGKDYWDKIWDFVGDYI